MKKALGLFPSIVPNGFGGSFKSMKSNEITHDTIDGYCCACDYDISGFEGRVKEQWKFGFENGKATKTDEILTYIEDRRSQQHEPHSILADLRAKLKFDV